MAKSKLPRSTPAARGAAVPPPKLAATAQQTQPLQSTPPPTMPQSKAPVAGASTPPRSASPVSNHDGDSAALSSAKKKKKKSKSKARDADFIDDHEYDLQSAAALGQRPRSPASLAARARAQAQLLAAASELYRRIEGDAQGIPDDDAYWTSLPAHLRTFIRNALPLGQFPPAAQAALNENAQDPANRHASTQAMIAVAQQLAQAAHASQRHLQQFPPGTHPYPPLPFDASIFADLALQPDQALPLHPHPNAVNNVHAANANGAYAQYSSSPNPPPTQPPVEPLPPPVVLYDNFDDEIDRFDDDGVDDAQYYDDGELDEDDDVLDAQGGLLRARERVWMQDGTDHVHGPNGMAAHPDALRSASKNKKKKKKKKGGAGAGAGHGDDEAHEIEVEVPPPPKPVPSHPPPSTNVSSVARNSNPPPPSSRAAGKQPMTFNSTGKTPARPANGVPPSSNSGKRSVSSSTHGQQPVANPAANSAKIWSTSSAEERERIKEFWLGLSMKDRQKLVQVEKETVLRKMKEQQKFLCSCAVCGRKRSAIEEELEVLYDAYYDELEEYANHQQRWASSGGTIPPPPGPGPFPGSVALDASGAVIGGDPLSRNRAAHGGRDVRHPQHPPPPHGRKAPLQPESSDGYDDDDLDDDGEYDDEDDDAEYEDEEEDDDIELEKERARDDYDKRNPVPSSRRRGTNDSNDLFGLGSSLTVKGGILTVADDMLKNDGRKFLEMMEQLAERRMHREELTNAELAASEDEEDVDGADDPEDDDDADEEEDDEEDDILTEEQRMEEGRKMFQIFAARMFEQRVLAAYRERVAQERQLQLLRELEEEDDNEKAREARRVKESQKKKDKKKAQREAKEAAQMRKDQEKAAADAELRAQQQAQRDAELKKQEEIRLKREAERKAKEDEKAKKEEERRRRQAEERDRQLEVERKRREKEDKARLEREAQEKAKRDREEAQRKAKEEQQRVQREKAEKELKAKEEQERKVEAAKKEKEARAQAQRESKQAAAAAAAASQARGSSGAPAAVPSSPSTGSRSSLNKSAPGTPARGAKTGSIPGSPAVASEQVQARGSQRATIGSKAAPGLAGASSGVAAAASSVAGSSLPAPPQGLPPRPTTAVLTPSGASSQSSSASVAANAGLPRPPVNVVGGGSASTVQPSLGFGSIAPTPAANVPIATSKAPGSSISPKPSQPFSQAQDKQSIPAGFNSVPPSYGQQPGLEGLRSPPLPNGMPAGGVFSSNGALTSSLQSPSLGGPPGIGGMTNNLASLTLNAPPGMNSIGGSKVPTMPGMETNASVLHGLAHSGLGGNVQSPTQTPFSPMSAGGNAVDPMRSRTASFADSDPMSFAGIRPGSSLSQRMPAYRSAAPAPIGPIGRPKAMDTIQQHVHEDHTGAIGNGRHANSAGGSSATSPRLPEGILGSSALGGDDDIIDPKPRRVSHTIPIGGGATGSSIGGGAGSFFGGGGMSGAGAVGGGFGVSASSPWSSFSGAGQNAPGPLSPGFSGGSAAPGSIGSSLASANFGLNQTTGTPSLGAGSSGMSNGAPSDPWARIDTNSWNRARYAFEQPGGAASAGLGAPAQAHAFHQNHLHGAGNGNLNPFNLGAPGSGSRNLFGAPGSNSLHPGAIGSALSSTSPGSRHVSGGHE